MEPEIINEEDDLDSYFQPLKDDTENQPSKFQQGVRQVERAGMRTAERVLGAPGDIIGLVRSFSDAIPESIKNKDEPNFIQKGAQRLLESVPGSEDLAARSAELRPDLEPETNMEAISDEWVGDMASLATGGTGLLKSLGMATLGNLGKQTVKELGFSENSQELTKLGMMLFTGMFSKGRGVKTHIDNLYGEARGTFPKGEKFSYPVSRLNKAENILMRGTVNSAKEEGLQIISDIRKKTSNGLMTVEDAMQFDKDINRSIGLAGNDKTKKGFLKQVKAAHSEAMDEYGKQNPSFDSKWNEAKQAYKGIETSENIQAFIKKNTNMKNIAHAGILLGLEESAIPGNWMVKLGTVGTTASIMYGKEMAKRLTTNPALRKYYSNVMKASLADNKGMLARNLAGLERVAKKEFEENPLPTFNFNEEED